MPLTLSAKKALRQSRRRLIANTKTKLAYKKALKEAREKKSQAALSQAFRALDQAAKKKVIPKGRANRLKKRMAKLLVKKAPPAKKIKKPSKKK